MSKKNNTSAYMNPAKKEIIKKSEYSYTDALEVSAFLIETGEFKKFYNKMKIADYQKELKEMEDE